MKYTQLSVICALLPTIAFATDDDCMTRRTVPDGVLDLETVVELGLCRNPETASAYYSLEATRLNKNAGYADYLPSVNASASFSKSYNNERWGDWQYSGPGGGVSISATYLIFDFGKRLANLNQLAATWRATGFDYDERVQNYVYGVIGAYYSLLNADADVESAKTARSVAKNALDAANQKYKSGVVARADVYKAETTLASRDLDLERAKNNREISKGTLLTKLAFPADQDIKIADMSGDFGTPRENKNIDELIEIARERRPDLLRASANKDAAWHRRNVAFLKNLPSISATGSVSWGGDSFGDMFVPTSEKINGSIGIRASMPIFAGFANMYGLRSAQASYDSATENVRSTNNNAMLDVFSAYQNYKTAQTVLTQTVTLLKSATESERLSAGMYRAGRSTMLDWQTAQSELVSAQKQNNAAKYDLYTKRAALALAIGDIKSELEKDE
ncbi:MAG: TolC family protein [Alphaproteobacteria bacterium]|nr:TolC family protein [Alphaproteobacteria bacterium]